MGRLPSRGCRGTGVDTSDGAAMAAAGAAQLLQQGVVELATGIVGAGAPEPGAHSERCHCHLAYHLLPTLSSDTHADTECHVACARRCCSLLSCPPPHRHSSSTWTTLPCNTAVGRRTHRPPASRAGTQRPRLLPPARLNNRPSSRRRSSRRQAMGRRALVLHMAHTVHRQAAPRSSRPRRSSRRQATGSRALALPMVGPQVSVAPMKSFPGTLQGMHARPHPGQVEHAAVRRFLLQHSNHEQGSTLGDSVLCPRNHLAALWDTSARSAEAR